MRAHSDHAVEATILTPIQVLASAFVVSSFAGLAALLRSDIPLSLRNVLAAFMYSGALGLIIGLVWYNEFTVGTSPNPYFLIGVSGLAGIGGVTAVDLAAIVLKKWGIPISLPGSKASHDNIPTKPDRE